MKTLDNPEHRNCLRYDKRADRYTHREGGKPALYDGMTAAQAAIARHVSRAKRLKRNTEEKYYYNGRLIK